MEELRGAIASETRVALVTVTDVVPVMEPEVALRVELPPATATPKPVALTVSMLGEVEDHWTEGRSWVLPSSKDPVAVNCCCVPAAIVGVAGVIAMDVKCAPTTVTVAVSLNEPTVAVMVTVPPARSDAKPVLSMVATDVDEELQATPLARSWLDPSL
jgi:hypothetical protein